MYGPRFFDQALATRDLDRPFGCRDPHAQDPDAPGIEDEGAADVQVGNEEVSCLGQGSAGRGEREFDEAHGGKEDCTANPVIGQGGHEREVDRAQPLAGFGLAAPAEQGMVRHGIGEADRFGRRLQPIPTPLPRVARQASRRNRPGEGGGAREVGAEDVAARSGDLRGRLARPAREAEGDGGVGTGGAKRLAQIGLERGLRSDFDGEPEPSLGNRPHRLGKANRLAHVPPPVPRVEVFARHHPARDGRDERPRPWARA
ncbi:MAG: hypothetical protein NZ523_05160 [Elioraea sp.]|nr:hypothetical protein [Elioraea sp.]